MVALGASLHSGHSLPGSAAILPAPPHLPALPVITMASSSVGPYTPDYDLRYRGYRLQATLYDGQALIHVREKVWYTRGSRQAGPSTSSARDGERRRGQFTKRGVTLTVDEWERLLQVAPDVEAACVAGTAYKADLGSRGRQVVVSSHQSEWRVNIRNYYDVKGDGNRVPTKIGVALSLRAFQRLRHVAEFVSEDLEEIGEELAVLSDRQHQEDRELEERRTLIRARREAAE